MSEQPKPMGDFVLRRLARWSGWRVALVSLAWVVLLLAVTLARVERAGRAYRRAHPGADTYLIGYGVPGGLWGVIGPPLILVGLWLWARFASRPTA